MIARPKILLLDEPLSALDKNLRHKMQHELKKLQHELGISFIFVTHDQEEALVMSDRIAVLNGGRIQQLDSPAKIYRTPSNEFVARFIGESNLLDATVKSTSGATCDISLRNGVVMTGCPNNGFVPGSQVKALIRPESVMDEKTGPDCHEISGTVAESYYVGTDHQLVIDDGKGVRLKATVRANADASRFAPGSSISIYVPNTSIHLIGQEGV